MATSESLNPEVTAADPEGTPYGFPLRFLVLAV